MNSNLNFATACRETLPTIFGYIGIAATFGIIGRTLGFTFWQVLFTSALVYAGSAQLTALNMIAAGNPVLSVVIATFLVNSCIILMSTTIASYFQKDPLSKNICLGSFLTDESFALGMNKINYTHGRLSFQWLNTTNILSYLTWVGATAIGAGIGTAVKNPQKFGLDFAIVAMFLGLLYLQVISDQQLNRFLQICVIAGTMVLTYLSLIVLPANLVIIGVTIGGCTLGVWLKHVL